MSDLYVMVELKETDGVYAAVDYQGTPYFVRMEDIHHVRGSLYSVSTAILFRVPLFNG